MKTTTQRFNHLIVAFMVTVTLGILLLLFVTSTHNGRCSYGTVNISLLKTI